MFSRLIDNSWPSDRATRSTWMVLLVVVAGGAALRFWGLGNIGLHGDEDVMGLATRALKETGWPVLPSGMEYVRALPQLYLMAASTYVFGDNEWALRLPSALVGAFGVLGAYWLARRFLSVNWSITFAVIIALLPSLISVSQTARMYIFYVTLLMLFAVAIFRWERYETLGAYLVALAIFLVGILFHALTVFSAFLFFYPGFVRSSWRLLLYAGIAFGFCVLFQQEHSAWVGSHYFDLVDVDSGEGGTPTTSLARSFVPSVVAVGLFGVCLAAGLAYLYARRRRMSGDRTAWFILSIACLCSALILAYFVQYHLAGIAYVLGLILFVRAGLGVAVPMAIGVLLVAMFSVHAYVSWQLPIVQDPLDVLERLAGQAYPKPYLTFSKFAPLGIVVYVAMMVYFCVRFARGKPLPDHVLFFLLAVFTPLFLMGFLSGQYVPPRYVIGFLPFFALVFLAGLAEFFGRFPRLAEMPGSQLACAVLAVLLFVDPRDLWYNVNPNSTDFPHLTDHRGVDHRGAAQYIRSLGLGAEDVVIAMDTQQQVYYLGERVDYYMRSLSGRAATFERGRQLLCLYTGRPQLTSGRELASLFSEPAHGEIYIIGSGELESNRSRYFDDGIWETMEAFGVEEVYVGRDQATKVWRYASHAGKASRRSG